MHEIKAIIRSDRLDNVVRALQRIPNLPGITVSVVTGYGRVEPVNKQGAAEFGQVAMTKLELVVPQDLLDDTLSCIRHAARTVRIWNRWPRWICWYSTRPAH
ncbi:MAG: P-II family nitrogen regulator [Acidobacteria bacterium]|nr:P-II family nitrogen regulator [Acidobacteriota bacterium]